MPAKIRTRCKFLDCQFLSDMQICTRDEIEIDPRKICLTYLPTEAPESDEAETDFADDDLDETSWEDIEEEEDAEEDDLGSAYEEE